MKIPCPNCGFIIEVNNLGRKRLPIHVNNICSALQYHSKGYRAGEVHYLNTAKKIKELFGVEVTGGFVQIRLEREMKINPAIIKKLERMKKIYSKSKEG